MQHPERTCAIVSSKCSFAKGVWCINYNGICAETSIRSSLTDRIVLFTTLHIFFTLAAKDLIDEELQLRIRKKILMIVIRNETVENFRRSVESAQLVDIFCVAEKIPLLKKKKITVWWTLRRCIINESVTAGSFPSDSRDVAT